MYKTKDLYCASALVEKGQKLFGVNKEGSVCWFLFEEKEKCEQFAVKYFFGELLVNARSYQETLRRLKNLIFSK